MVGGGERVGIVKVRLFRPFSAEALTAALRRIRPCDRRARSHQGARRASASRSTRTSSPRSSRRSRPAHAPRRDAARDRRTIRPVLQGVHPRHGEGCASTRWTRTEPRNHFTVGIVDDVSRHESAGRSRFRYRVRRRRARGLLRAGQRRNGERQQELDQDHRRAHRPVRTGLLRLRLEEGRRRHGLASAVRPRSDPLDLSDPLGRVRGVSPVRTPGAHRRARRGRARRDLPAEQPLRPGRGVGPSAAEPYTEADRGQAAALLRCGRRSRWPRRPGSASASTP